MELVKIRNSQELSDYLMTTRESRLNFEKKIAEEYIDKKNWYLSGFCDVCEKETKFLMDWNYSNGTIPNFRERLVCQFCDLNNRQRFMVRLITQLITENGKPNADIYLYEQITNFYSFIKKKFERLNIVGSEYLGPEIKSGQIINDVMHEDALNLSFDDNSFDFLISNEVFEHIPNINKALSEGSRVLRSGGYLLASIPFFHKEKTTRRAVIENGIIKHLLPEEYHGNPLSDKGSLVFYDYGWDFLDFCIANGFKDAYMLCYYSYSYGYIGDGFQFVFVMKK